MVILAQPCDIAQFAVEPGPRLEPITPDRTIGHAQRLGGGDLVETGEKAALDHLRQPRTENGKFLHGIVDEEDVAVVGLCNVEGIVQGQRHFAVIALPGASRVHVVDEHLTHRERGRREEMLAIAPSRRPLQTQPRLADERRRAERGAGTGAQALAPRDAAQLVVQQVDQCIEGSWIRGRPCGGGCGVRRHGCSVAQALAPSGFIRSLRDGTLGDPQPLHETDTMAHWHPLRRIGDFMRGEAAGGIVLMVAAAAALLVANSPWGDDYRAALGTYLGPLSVLHWINDALMAVFFLLVGLEIKREALDGELATWPKRVLPGLCAVGGMVVPALIYVGFNGSGEALRGWAIPTATDIAFALGVVSLLGSRVPMSLKVFLTALAIIDDLLAVLIIAVFYTDTLRLAALGGAFTVLAVLVVMNRMGVRVLWPYLSLGLVLWWLVLLSGVHATLAGVALAMTIPLDATGDITTDRDESTSPLLRLEHALHRVVPFFIIPVFGFANAGLSFAGIGAEQVLAPLTLGVAAGLLFGKLVGVFGVAWLAVKAGLAPMPPGATWRQVAGIASLCGIGFTMSLFIGMLAFAQSPILQDEVKLGILGGSLVAGVLGALLLLPRRPAADVLPH